MRLKAELKAMEDELAELCALAASGAPEAYDKIIALTTKAKALVDSNVEVR